MVIQFLQNFDLKLKEKFVLFQREILLMRLHINTWPRENTTPSVCTALNPSI